MSAAKLAPLTGLVFLALFPISFIVSGEPPEVDESTAEVASFYADNETANIVGALLGGIAAAALVWFGASVRVALRAPEGSPGRLSAVSFSGFVVMALGIAMWSGFQYAAADTAGDVPPEVTQALAVLTQWFFLPFAMGVLLTFLASGIVILRHHGAMPRWLGYVALPVPVFFFTPAWFVGLFAAVLWIGVTSVLLFRAGEDAAPAAPEAAAGGVR